jgi:predicted Zn-dependent peptidase
LKFAVVGGSSAESLANKGAANYLAHAAYAGSQSISGNHLVKKLESLGASYSAYSDRDKVCSFYSVSSVAVEYIQFFL